MQELFSQLEIDHPYLFNKNTLTGRQFINDYYKFFEKEKLTIFLSYNDGCLDSLKNEIKLAEEYYNAMYKIKNN